MLAQLERFWPVLRRAGLRVSTAEVIDAVQAAAAVGFDDRERLRAALAACVVKSRDHRRTFDELFDLQFARAGELSAAGAGNPIAGALAAAGATDDEIAALLEALRAEVTALSAIARAGLGGRAPELAALIRAAGAAVELDRISSPLQIGHYGYRVMTELGAPAAEAELVAMLARLVDRGQLTAAQADLLAEVVRGNFRRLRELVRAHVERTFRAQNLDFIERVTVSALADKPLAQLSEREIADLRGEVMRLARVLRAKVTLRPKHVRHGRLDLRRTLRRSLATGGIPFAIVRRHRRRHKPRLIVLCDISDSVRNVSRFMLLFVYTLQELFERVDSYAFVADIGELTELFRRHDVGRAVELAHSGAVVNVFANSNYGRALKRFAERYMQKVTRRTTVLVIGDGRNNYNPPHAHVLGQLRKRAKQVWWLNPEARAAWGFGDSAMRDYEPHCDKVVVANNLSSLHKVVDELVM